MRYSYVMIKNLALDTLFHLFESGIISYPAAGQRTLFLNTQDHRALNSFQCEMSFQQSFRPFAKRLKAAGHRVCPDFPEEEQSFDMVIIAAPKNQIETLYLIACGLGFLKPNGLLIAAAENKAGGSRLQKNMAHFDLENLKSESRNKSRAVWTKVLSFDEKRVEQALTDGAMQGVLDGCFQSQPGVFGWNKLDQGSQVLLQHLPDELKGKGADFGCGYGLLSRYVLENYKLKSLTCIDAEARAVEACRLNLEGVDTDAELTFEWVDLTQDLSHVSGLDFIVMNPPFHEGKKVDLSIGEGFIKNAAVSLKRNGSLWMVANKQLPYEPILQEAFFRVETVFEGRGFKVFCAVK